ncbi:MAG: MFS transporter [Betaproteobacteria bacterium]|nr:MFS transporter [Betaproteobacteria bacterium]
MSAEELRAGASLAGIFGLRMLGLFLILPVFAVHAPQLAGGHNLVLVGIALGAYGLVQAILQIPFGMASDRWGRKPVIVAGLLVFAAGSFLAAAAQDIWMAIAGRGLQGAGAISAVVMALAADLTREQHRVKVMAMVGASIGLSFALSLVAAPALYHLVGMGGLFVLTGLLALAAIVVVVKMVPPAPPRPAAPADAPGALRLSLLDPQLVRLNAGIFVLHSVQMAMFVVVPPLLVASGLPIASHWKVYLPVVLASFALMAPPIWYADRRNAGRGVMLGAIALLALAEGGFSLAGPRIGPLAMLLLAFFAAFNVLEALIPSLVSRIAPAHARGTAIGVYNTTQTLGLFCGGLAGGWIAEHFGPAAVFGTCTALALAWIALAAGMRPVNRLAAESFTMSTVKGR